VEEQYSFSFEDGLMFIGASILTVGLFPLAIQGIRTGKGRFAYNPKNRLIYLSL
jgi:hypothetical protein